MGKSKRYFNYRDHRSSSPTNKKHEKKLHKSSHSQSRTNHSSSYGKHSSISSSSSSSFDKNKLASERLKKSIQDQLKEASNCDNQNNNAQSKSKIFVPIEEQINFRNKIDEINKDSFKPTQFISNREQQQQQSNINSIKSINLSEIPLPKDVNSWRDNPRLLFGSKVNIHSTLF